MKRGVVVVASWCAVACCGLRANEVEKKWDAKAMEVLDRLQGGARFRPPSRPTQGPLGLLFSAAGTAEFVEREVVPAARYLDALGVRESRALMLERSLADAARPVLMSFKYAYYFEDYWPSRAGSASKMPMRARAKVVKIVAMATAPFETTIFLDFDSRPCVVDFAARLAAEAGSADVALTNKYEGQELTSKHFDLEHNSACVVLRKTPATARLMEYWLEAFVKLGSSRDQPSLALALKKAQDVRHTDLSGSTFCRNKISQRVSCDASCLVVHKPQKHDASLKLVVLSHTPELALMLDALKVEPRCDVAARLRLADDYARHGITDHLWAVAEKYRVFWEAPFASGDVYEELSRRFPKAKFIGAKLTLAAATRLADVVRGCDARRLAKFAKLYDARPEPAELARAQEARLNRARRKLGDRYLQVDIDDMSMPQAWRLLCDFVEAWTPCPIDRPRPASVAPAWCPSYGSRVATHLNRSREATASPPKPQPRPSLSLEQERMLKRALPIVDPPRWTPACAPRYPRGVFYNRLPKSGSASIMAWMSAQLNATAKHRYGLPRTAIKWWTPHVAKHRWLSPADEVDFIATVRRFADAGDFVTQRHVYHTPDLARVHPRGVAFVNVVRDPVDRCVSRYNYEAFYKKRIPAVDLDDCIESKRCDFDGWTLDRERHVYRDYPVPTATASAADRAEFLRLSQNESMMLLMDECHDYTTRWFCGHSPACRDPTDPDNALALAKRNVLADYAHVGVLEDLPNTVQLFRLLLPSFFEGDPSRTPDEADFPQLHSQKTLARKDAGLRKPPGAQTKSGPLAPHNLRKLLRANRRDLDLYYFILDRHRRKVKLCLQTNGTRRGPATLGSDDALL